MCSKVTDTHNIQLGLIYDSGKSGWRRVRVPPSDQYHHLGKGDSRDRYNPICSCHDQHFISVRGDHSDGPDDSGVTLYNIIIIGTCAPPPVSSSNGSSLF